MDGWMVGWLDCWLDGCLAGSMDRWIDGLNGLKNILWFRSAGFLRPRQLDCNSRKPSRND